MENKKSIKELYEDFLDISFEKLNEYQEPTQMEDETLIAILGNIFNTAMNSAVDAHKINKQNELVDIQKQTEIAKLKRELGAEIDSDGNLEFLDDGKSQIENQINLIKEQTKTQKENTDMLIAKLRRELGVKVQPDGTLVFLTDGNSHIETQISSEKEKENLIKEQTKTQKENTDMLIAKLRRELGVKVQPDGTLVFLTDGNSHIEKRNRVLESQYSMEMEKKYLIQEEKSVKREQKYTIIAKRKTEQGVTSADKWGINYMGNQCGYKDGAQTMLLCKQKEKVSKDIEYTNTQKTKLEEQVRHNALIQAADKQADYILGLGQGGLMPKAIQHANFYSTLNHLTSEVGLYLNANIGDLDKLNGTDES